ncbi:MAG: GTP-binding protein, partial [Variovorax sp.]
MSATTATPATASDVHGDTGTALRFITCGSVDDGKSTLIGRLLVDSKTVLQDQLAGVQRGGETDLALLTDGLSAEREQGITIDVAYRYFSTAKRKFIIGDAPGHEQYTRNMVTAASAADAAVVLVDATKLPWAGEVADGEVVKQDLLPQTRRHTLLCNLLRVQSIVFAVNKLDAMDDAEVAFERISTALNAFAEAAGVQVAAIVPISALKGWNVASPCTEQADWAGYQGPSLLELLEALPVTAQDEAVPFAFPVQWVEKFSASADTTQGRRVFWGRVASGHVAPGQRVTVLPSKQTATVAQVLNHVRQPQAVHAGHSAGIVLDR